MKNKIEDWLSAGGQPEAGISLLEEGGSSGFFIRILRADPKGNSGFIRRLLCFRYQVIEDARQRASRTIREDFPFLNDPGCPIELKALITDKFSSFYAYRGFHRQLFDCTSLAECADKARKILSSYKENRMIYAELEYYRDHKQILGIHPVFASFTRIRGYRSMDMKALLKKQQKLKHNIWRIQSELQKGDKPHLDTERKMSLDNKQAELAEINRILGDE